MPPGHGLLSFAEQLQLLAGIGAANWNPVWLAASNGEKERVGGEGLPALPARVASTH